MPPKKRAAPVKEKAIVAPQNDSKGEKKIEAKSDEKPKKTEQIDSGKKAGKTKSAENGGELLEETKPVKKASKMEKGANQDSKVPKTRGKTRIETGNVEEDSKRPKKRGKTPNKAEDVEEAVDEPVAKQKRGRKPKEASAIKEDDSEKDVEPPKKVGRKKTEKKEIKPKKTKKEDDKFSDPVPNAAATGKNIIITDWNSINFSSDKKNEEGNVANFKITSWNVAGLKSWLSKKGMNILIHDLPDILCLQETKCFVDDLPDEIANLEGYKSYWCASEKKGYAGVGLLTKTEPVKVLNGIGDDQQDAEGRCITAEFEHFFLVNVYVPNAGRKLVSLDKRLDWNAKFKDFIKELDAKKPVIVCGDMNVAHNEIDLKNPGANKKNAGFTREERDGMTEFLESGFADTFRTLYPDKEGVYTFWTYMANARQKNVGWRLDYFLVSTRFKSKVCDSVALSQVYGSDHCPITLYIHV